MPEMQDCLSRRYQALDDLIAELTAAMSSGRSGSECKTSAEDICIKLMCEFWNILKDDPHCNLTQAICQRMGLSTKCQGIKSQNLTCYMAGKDISSRNNKTETRGVNKQSCSKPEQKQTCCNSKTIPPTKSTTNTSPLGNVLCNLKEAVSFEQKCNARISELMSAQTYLQEQIQELEEREKEGIQMLKQADCMWSCMEEAYKKKVAQSLERQNILLKQMKEIETSNTKWRKNKQDLEFQLGNVNKCHQEIKEKLQEKESEVKCVNMDIENFNKRIEALKKEVTVTRNSLDDKKNNNKTKIANLSAEVDKLKKIVHDQDHFKKEKEMDGTTYIKDAREDLQKIYRVLLQKKIENEDLKAEKDALLLEIDLHRRSCNQCEDTCTNKQTTVTEEIAKIDAEIAGFQVKCFKCHTCTDTIDIRKFCIDCPKCVEERKCLSESDRCYSDFAMDCVCMSVKQSFMDNVFENMYNVLRGQVKSSSGQAVADAILTCLKKSRNGKLNDETRQILQNFVLTTIKKNLNITVIGGAVKTRCEMDPETYQQLMSCLKRVKTASISKEDKGTIPRKEPCSRWNTANECHCPKGPTGCICSKLAPPALKESKECASEKKKGTRKEELHPEKDSTTRRPDTVSRKVLSADGTDVSTMRSPPCDEKHCTFGKNMRAAQCVLGPDSLVLSSNSEVVSKDTFSDLDNEVVCECGPTTTKPCLCLEECKCNPRERMIEEVMGRYTDMGFIEKDDNLNEEFRKFIIKEAKQFIVVPPAILKITDSHYYQIVVDKEYEKEFRSVVTKQLDTNFKYPLKLSKTFSGTAIMELKKKSESRTICNAYLLRSLSGELKVFADESTNTLNSAQISCNSEQLCSKESCNDLLRIMESLRKPTKGLLIRKSYINKRSSSNSNLYSKCKFNSEEKLLTDANIALNKSPPGQYAVILDKKSVSTKQPENGDILNQCIKEINMKNSILKICPSDNILTVTDKYHLNEYFLSENSKCGNMSTSKRRVETTTYNLSSNSSRNVSRCICAEFYQNDGTNIMPKKCSKSFSDVSKKCKGYKSRGKSPHIVIRPKPCCPSSTTYVKKHSNQQVVCVTEPGCLFHKHTYDTVSSNLFEMSRQCEDKTIMKNGNSNIQNQSKRTELDYLDSLPPQLPSFLSNLLF